MRDLFLQCTCVHTCVRTYVCMYMSVMLRNVVDGHAQAGYWIPCALHDDVGTTFLAMEDGEDCAAGPLQRTYLAKSSAGASAECGRRLATLTKNKTKRSVHRRSQESEKRTRKSSTAESTYWRFFTSCSLFTLPLFCTALWTLYSLA